MHLKRLVFCTDVLQQNDRIILSLLRFVALLHTFHSNYNMFGGIWQLDVLVVFDKA